MKSKPEKNRFVVISKEIQEVLFEITTISTTHDMEMY